MGFVRIQDWDYLITDNGNGYFTVWHHVTPADGGYGTEVKQKFRIGRFTRDNIGLLYSHISALHQSPQPSYYNEKEETEALIREMERLGLLAK